MSTVPVSVIIPTYDRPRSVERCLDALAAQIASAGQFEVIVVDDGSASPLQVDGSRWSTRFPLTVIRQRNTGPAGARNRGATIARGDFLAFTDDDCLPSSTWLERLLAALQEHPDALVGGSTYNGLTQSLFAETSQFILEMAYEYFNREPSDAVFFASNNMACAQGTYLALGGFDPRFRLAAEDRDFCDRWRMAGHPLRWIPEAVVEHRHQQYLGSFTRLHFRYGRAAWFHHRMRTRRGSGTMAPAVGFHRRIPRMVWERRRRFGAARLAGLAGLLAWWEAVNLAGFVTEWARNQVCDSKAIGQ